MFPFFYKKMSNWLSDQKDSVHPFNLYGPGPKEFHLIFSELLKQDSFKDFNHVLIFENSDLSEAFYEKYKNSSFFDDYNLFFHPFSEVSLYNSILYSKEELLEKTSNLYRMFHYQREKKTAKKLILSCSFYNFFEKLPPRSFFDKNFISLKITDIVPADELSKNLINLGYQHLTLADSPGSFTKRGEIFDIYPSASSSPYRLVYFDEMIESIHPIDPETNRIKDEALSELIITPLPQAIISKESINRAGEIIGRFGPSEKNKFEKRKSLLHDLLQFKNHIDFPKLFPLFFSEHERLTNYLPDPSRTILHFINSSELFETYNIFLDSLNTDFELSLKDKESDSILPHYSYFYYNTNFLDSISLFPQINIQRFEKYEISEFDQKLKYSLNFKTETLSHYLSRQFNFKTNDKLQLIEKIIASVKEKSHYYKKIIFSYSNEKSKDEIIHLLKTHSISLEDNKLSLIHAKIENGFFYEAENLILISDADLFSYKNKTPQSKKRSLDLFAEQIATLKIGDFVVHAQYGVGKYLGLQQISVGNQQSDFLAIEYGDQDKAYIPVYKINLVQKYADANTPTTIDDLRSKKFENAKARARKSVKELAFNLLELQAQRQSKQAFSFSPPDHLDKEFELSFPYEETPDQIRAIEDVFEDMQKETPMDRLICGDVGFGKTEVAMRAAFKAVLDKKQVAVLVPTTILALQHYQSFSKRMQDFGVKVELLSRLVSGADSKSTILKANAGEIDILIGTHKILNDEIKFKDLGLVIIDEEQRFGVTHKEKLKLLRSTVDCLTMTATPIPRTLQLSFLGIRDLSLIQTPPLNRQSIKSYIIKDDPLTLKKAIEQELSRGGQVFFVHNRVQSIEHIFMELKTLVPQAKIIYAHGQLPPKELEKRMLDFIEKKYDILLATTIIESGIDIPSANTMIVDKAHSYGLSQLHQLRGRIGRSDKKAYAYFIIPNDLNISEIAEKRLQALQTYSEIGSGFSIASCDLELRGAGDILGAEQSGHIESIGLELYMELLQEAMEELQAKNKNMKVQQKRKKDVEIQTPFNAYIPEKYINDSSLRLKYYKQLANSDTKEQLESLMDELRNRFGNTPKELDALYCILALRTYLQLMGISSLALKGQEIQLKFDETYLNENTQVRDNLVKLFLEQPKKFKINPQFIVVCKITEINEASMLLDYIKSIWEKVRS